MKDPIRRGHVYWLPDSAVELPPKGNRVLHPRRPFLVMSNDAQNTDTDWPIVFGFPLSTSDEHATEFDVYLDKWAAGLPHACYVRVPLAQAVDKTKLQDRTGQLDANTLEEVLARHFKYLGAY